MSNRELDYGNVSKMLAEAREMQETGKYINGTVYHTLADEVERLQARIAELEKALRSVQNDVMTGKHSFKIADAIDAVLGETS